MTFPLPYGCRSVCRPPRKKPRVPTAAVVARMAKAAVKNGESACFVSSEVAKAVDCSCSGQFALVKSDSFEVTKDLVALQEALRQLAKDLGAPDRIQDQGRDKWTEQIARGLRKLVKWLVIVYDLAEVIAAAETMAVSTGNLLLKIIDLGICLGSKGDGEVNRE